MAQFSEKPYLVLNTATKPSYFSNPEVFRQDNQGFRRFAFAGPLQRFGTEVETTELLIGEFERMWAAVDLQGRQPLVNTEKDRGAEVHTWLR
jgi:hypothetical protein